MMPFEVTLIYYSIQTTDFPHARPCAANSANYIVAVNSTNWCDFFVRCKSHHSSMINACLSHISAKYEMLLRWWCACNYTNTLSCGFVYVTQSVQLNIYKSFSDLQIIFRTTVAVFNSGTRNVHMIYVCIVFARIKFSYDTSMKIFMRSHQIVIERPYQMNTRNISIDIILDETRLIDAIRALRCKAIMWMEREAVMLIINKCVTSCRRKAIFFKKLSNACGLNCAGRFLTGSSVSVQASL